MQPIVAEGGRTIAIGDIHGCASALRAILDAIQPRPADTIVTLGDYIDRGEESKAVLELLLRLQQQCHLIPLLGNHEQMLLAAREGRDDLRFWLRQGGDATLRSYGAYFDVRNLPWEHLQFIRSCRLYYETNSHIFVHANYDATQPMEKQKSDDLLWKHFSAKEAVPHCSGKHVILGHTPQASGRVLDLHFAMCIDTGCGYGGPLTAIDIESGQHWHCEGARHNSSE